jgi:hypothetical protein
MPVDWNRGGPRLQRDEWGDETPQELKRRRGSALAPPESEYPGVEITIPLSKSNKVCGNSKKTSSEPICSELVFYGQGQLFFY